MQTDQLTVDTQSIATCLARQGDVVVGYLFGSVARGQATAQSDVDALFRYSTDARIPATGAVPEDSGGGTWTTNKA